MPRGKYPRKKTVKLTPIDKADLAKAADVAAQVSNGAAEGAPRNFSFESPARPWHQYFTIIHGRDGTDRNIVGTSELPGEIVERLRANNPKAVRISIMRVTVEETFSWSLEQDPL